MARIERILVHPVSARLSDPLLQPLGEKMKQRTPDDQEQGPGGNGFSQKQADTYDAQ